MRTAKKISSVKGRVIRPLVKVGLTPLSPPEMGERNLPSSPPLSFSPNRGDDRGRSLLFTKGLRRGSLGKGRTQLFSTSATQSGFTIIESLMAMIVVTVLMAAVAPVIVLSTATRVQARRAELATQAARTYIDGVKSGAIAPPQSTVLLDDNLVRTDFAAAPAPDLSALSANCTASTYCQDDASVSLYCVDIDGDGECTANKPADLVVQGFRSVTTAVTEPGKGYVLGVRVYSASGFSGSEPLSTQRARQTARGDIAGRGKQSTFTAGLGDRKAPLMEITTEVTGTGSKFSDYCTRLGCL